ncbi:MAG: hypothetical protein KJ963_03725 [Bacteroidetes bacterium]|nr:hypothetical protein [Bacteroidota bacterium]
MATIKRFEEVQAYGDRLNIIVEDNKRDFPIIQQKFQTENIKIEEWHIIDPSLENIFISLMSN